MRTFNEERPFFREERLVGSEIDFGRIGFDLAEIRIEGRVERQVRTDAKLEIQAEPAAEVPAVVKRISRIDEPGEIRRAGKVGQQFQTFHGLTVSSPTRSPNLDAHAVTVLGMWTQ